MTKSLGGQDTALGGYIATNDAELGNQIMDLIAMRGGILDDDARRRVAGTSRRRERSTRAAARPPPRSPRSSPAIRASSACSTRRGPIIPTPR